MTQDFNFDYARAAQLKTPAYQYLAIYLVGCGGTGSWLAPAVVRVGRLMQERFDKHLRICFIDPDAIEEKNVYRQNFCEAEIGENKAVTLAERYGLAWGIEISALPKAFTAGLTYTNEVDQLTMIIGCVDNTSARAEIAKMVQYRSNTWWLDCGNEKNTGQVLLGGNRKIDDPFSLPSFCSWLPLPSEQAPDLVKKGGPNGARQRESQLSCAEMALQDSQGLAINQRVAAEAADYLVRMLVTQDLRKMATFIDLESGTSKSRYITPENVSVETENKP